MTIVCLADTTSLTKVLKHPIILLIILQVQSLLCGARWSIIGDVSLLLSLWVTPLMRTKHATTTRLTDVQWLWIISFASLHVWIITSQKIFFSAHRWNIPM